MHKTPKLDVHDPIAVQRKMDRIAHDKALRLAMRECARVSDGSESAFYIVQHRGVLPWGVMAEMAQAGIEVFCPVEKVQRRVGRHRRVEVSNQPKYPGYFFVELPVNDARAFVGVTSFEGVVCMMGEGERPRAISLEVMEKIRRPLHFKRDIVRLMYAIGDVVEVTNGTFKSFTGHVVAPANGKGLVRFEIDIFGALVPVLMGVDSVRKL